jgi:hypothetical protein
MAKAVFCIAKNEVQVEAIVNRLKTAGFSPNEISVLFPDQAGTRDFAHEQHTKAPEGAAMGAGTGGVLGGALADYGGVEWSSGRGSTGRPHRRAYRDGYARV